MDNDEQQNYDVTYGKSIVLLRTIQWWNLTRKFKINSIILSVLIIPLQHYIYDRSAQYFGIYRFALKTFEHIMMILLVIINFLDQIFLKFIILYVYSAVCFTVSKIKYWNSFDCAPKSKYREKSNGINVSFIFLCFPCVSNRLECIWDIEHSNRVCCNCYRFCIP